MSLFCVLNVRVETHAAKERVRPENALVDVHDGPSAFALGASLCTYFANCSQIDLQWTE